MAVSSFWPVRTRLAHVLAYAMNEEKTIEKKAEGKTDETSLSRVLQYAVNESKTEQSLYVSGLNCNPERAVQQFRMVKQQFGKEGGIQAYHGYVSFAGQEVTPGQAHAIGLEIARQLWGERYQVIVATHLNTENVHNHFVVNSVSFVDGKRCRETSWWKNYPLIDRICREYGLSIVEKPTRNPEPEYFRRKEAQGIPTRYSVIREAVEEALQASVTRKDLSDRLRKLGYACDLNERHKYWTVTPPGSTRAVRLYQLGEAYTNEKIRERLNENLQGRYRQMPEQKRTRGYRLPQRKDKLQRQSRGSLYGLYLYYCYLLGVFPSYRKKKRQKVSGLLRKDLHRVRQLSERARLLAQYRIETEAQLQEVIMKSEEELGQLKQEKQSCIRLLKRADGGGNREETERKSRALSERMRRLRKEVRLCQEIKDEAEALRQTLMEIEREEQSRKEKQRHEQWR